MNGTRPIALPAGAVAARWRPARLVTALLCAVLIAGGLALFVPLAWVVLTTLKTPPEVTRLPITWLPDDWTNTANFVRLFSEQPFGRYFLNSFIVAGISLLSSTTIAVLAGYAFAKIQFRGKEVLFVLVLAVFMVPLETMVLPLYLMLVPLHLVNTYLGLALPDLFTAFGVFLMRQFMEDIPDAYIDAARIDGASELKVLWKVVLPMVRPALASFVIIKFMWSWNQFLWPLIVGQQQDMYTVTVGLVYFAGQWFNDWTMIATAAALSMVPMTVIFLVLQRYLVQGLMMSGLKG
jgi:ABC-type glycerol-3-phosphate transport system permease component